LALSSYTLAYELIKLGKKPELAVTIGLLIGGFKCQFLTAHAIIRPLEDGTYEIYINISYHDHWEMEIFEGPHTSSDCIDSRIEE
jgi:hypothetical protein